MAADVGSLFELETNVVSTPELTTFFTVASVSKVIAKIKWTELLIEFILVAMG